MSCRGASYAATDALYLGDTSLLETTATVLGVEEGEKGWTAVLDATVFHPQGGGQPSDVGTLGDATVVSVFADGRAGQGGVVYHALEAEPTFAVGDAVACRVDAEHRLRSARTRAHCSASCASASIAPAVLALVVSCPAAARMM